MPLDQESPGSSPGGAMATVKAVAFFLALGAGDGGPERAASPRLQIRHPDIAFVGSHGEVEGSTVGREAVERMLPVGIVESDQHTGRTTRPRHCPDRRARGPLADVVNALAVGRPRGIEGLLARR